MVASVDLIGIGKLIVGSSYIPYGRASKTPKEVHSLIDFCKVRSLPLLLRCGDNSHHKLWSSMGTNRRGKDLVTF